MPCYDHLLKCFVNKLRTSTKMKHLGGLVCWWRQCWVSPRASYLVEGGVNLRSLLEDCHSGLKRLPCLPCFRILLVQLMTIWALSWLIKMWGFNLCARYGLVVKLQVGTDLASMVALSFWKVLSHSSLWVEWVLRWKCTTPAGCQTNRLAVSPVMDNLSL
jgi:hypothetical protein